MTGNKFDPKKFVPPHIPVGIDTRSPTLINDLLILNMIHKAEDRPLVAIGLDLVGRHYPDDIEYATYLARKRYKELKDGHDRKTQQD